MQRVAYLLSLCLAVFGGNLRAEDFSLNSLFSDHMVLQRNQPIRVFGTGTENSEVVVRLAGQEGRTTVRDGIWEVHLPAMQAGGPHLMEIDNGGGWTGWGKAWMICLAARFQDANLSEALLESIIAQNTYYNLFNTHPRNAGNSSCFQIDGNFGTLAGITEMLLQTHDGCVDILPAKPAQWIDGHINGLRGRGNITVDISWAGSKLKTVKIKSFDGGEKVIKYGEQKVIYNFSKGETVTFDGKLTKTIN